RGRNALAWLIGRLHPVRKTTAAELQKRLGEARPPKVLVVRPHQGLGDLLLATPIFRAIGQRYPGAEVHFLADTYNYIAINGNPHLHRLWLWDKKRMQKLPRLVSFMRSLRAERFDVAIALSSHIPSFTSFMIGRFSGARALIGFETTSFYGGANWSRHLAHLELPAPPADTPQWETFMELVRPLGAEATFEPDFYVAPEDRAWAEDRWSGLSIRTGRKTVGLFLGGNPDRPERLWPPVRWRELAAALQDEPDVEMVLIVPPKDFLSGSRARERGIYTDVAGGLREPAPVFSEANLKRLAAFLQGLDLFVCVDGGLFHVAVAARVPTLGLFFLTDPACWKPPVPWATVLRPADDQPMTLTSGEVIRNVRRLLNTVAPAILRPGPVHEDSI
ncbi:MAG TPA: glycosyltransferase family 9 protein, partial [Elusimicrobiota bacterium]|nr:glycosyltransferase family 9 protein [Elusimicrobiota bacterium]